MRGLEWVSGAMVVPLLCLVLDQWVRSIRRRRRSARLIGQTIAYFHRSASEAHLGQDADSRLVMRTADFAQWTAMLNGVAAGPPNGDLVVYDSMPRDKNEWSVSHLFRNEARVLGR